jgi:hypothetical protein
MKINFGNYTYYDGKLDDINIMKGSTNYSSTFIQSRMFDENKFNQLISNRQYNDAADYAAQFHFNDPETQKAHENDIINLRRNGRVLGAIYGRVQDPTDLAKITFADNVFIDGGLERSGNNDLNTAFENIKSKICSTVDKNGNVVNEASTLEIIFEPKTNKLLGIDWLMPDNDNNIENFYKNSGLNVNTLRDNGVQVINKDGRTILRFDKSNPLANKILYKTPVVLNTTFGDLNKSILANKPTKIIGYNKKGEVTGETDDLREFDSFIKDAINTKEKYFEDFDLTYKDYSSSIGPMISDELSSLKAMLNSGQIDETQYNRQAKAIAPHIFSAINTLGSGNYEMYTNYLNEKPTDETLVPVENKDRATLTNLISSYAPKDIDVSAMVSNGKIGTLITLEGTGNETESDKNDGRRIQIFVPGLLQEEAQAKINRNTSTRAVQELNSMIDWGYSYKLRNGSEIGVNNKGQFTKDKEVIDKQSAIQEINKDMIMEESLANLKFQYMNSDGNITDNLKYEEMAKLLAMNTISDVYGDIKLNIDYNSSKVALSDKFGNIYNPDDIFNRKINENETQYEVYDRLNEIYAIYNELMNELNFYK